MSDYRTLFQRITGYEPRAWQTALGDDAVCRDRMIRIPTGFGKTAGIVMTWLHHRVVRGDDAWPRRLVFCLPMRVLVEQTEGAIKDWLAKIEADVGLHVLMGGVKAAQWVERIEQPAILIGTQDMLLSRALNRGYAAGRGLWPMEHGLLHQDALWAFDEVQLMDVGLATSAQLAAFRDQDVAGGRARLRPVHTWWMSATLQPRWLATVDRPAPIEAPLSIPAAQRRGGLFAVRKVLARAAEVTSAETIAECVRARHQANSLTLVIVNRVTTAIAVYDALVGAFSNGKGKKRALRPDGPELKLVHSRFRGAERSTWAKQFLRRDASVPPAGRIIVATQVVEAGVDISARALVTELAPWSSLVQRFGRAARYEDDAGEIVVVGAVPADDKAAAPYSARALAAADEGIGRLLAHEADASLRSLEAFEEELAKSEHDLLARLYPYEPLHVLRRRDLDDLFDTSADVSGADLDISRFIRSGEERDVTVFWRILDGKHPIHLDEPQRREELCPVPIGDIRAWKNKAYVFDYLDGAWIERKPNRLVPGMTVLLDASAGGYTVERGWGGEAPPVEPVPLVREREVGAPVAASLDALAAASSMEGGDDLSIAPQWKTIATHGREAEAEASALCASFGFDESLTRVVALAARWHDAGKAHRVFQDAIRADHREPASISARRDLAKAPKQAWRRPAYPERPGFRHELASTLALFELLRRTHPLHAALLGPHRDLLAALGTPIEMPETTSSHPLADEVAKLSADEFNLLAWLVCTHHGKVRSVWTSTPHDQESGRGGIHGVWEGDELPDFVLTTFTGEPVEVPTLTLSLAAAEMGLGSRYGASWAERVAGLLRRYGPFALTFLEAVLRVADWRASRLPTEDQLA